jgi:RNA polymerase sigma-70 factor (ECF subfamily)
MSRTSPSLLQRLRSTEDQQAWTRFTDLYVPLLYGWGRRLGLQTADAADLVQDVLAAVVRELPKFAYDPSQSFRGWLRQILVNRWRTVLRRLPMAPLTADPPAPESLSDREEAEYRSHLIGETLRHIRHEFSAIIWRAFELHSLLGRPAEEVAAELEIALGTVYVAKSRVLKRLREELAGLLE